MDLVSDNQRLVLGSAFKWGLLLLALINVAWNMIQIASFSWRWVSLSLMLYLGIALVLIVMNSFALMLPGKKNVPVVTLLVILFGFSIFFAFPHNVVMF